MSWQHLVKSELYAVFTNIPLLLTVFGGIVVYSFLYPLPYLNQIPKEQKIAVIDLDNSQLSRTIISMADATPQIMVTKNIYSSNEAKRLVIKNQIAGYLMIPEHFYRDLLLGKSPSLLFSGDASYFLVYGTVIEGLVRSSSTLSAGIKVKKMVADGQSIALASSQYTPIPLNLKPTFNSGLGYLNYVVPAVFILILHQTLLIAAGLLTCGQLNDKDKNTASAKYNNSYVLTYPIWQILCVRALVLFSIYCVMSSYYLGFSFEYYDITRLAHIADLIAVTVPFLLSTIFFGIVLGLIIPRKELVTLVVLLSSLPLVFSAGFIWPTESIPPIINFFAQFIPSTTAINAFLRLNQMGASISDIVQLKEKLWLLVVLYGVLAYLLIDRKRVSVIKATEARESHRVR